DGRVDVRAKGRVEERVHDAAVAEERREVVEADRLRAAGLDGIAPGDGRAAHRERSRAPQIVQIRSEAAGRQRRRAGRGIAEELADEEIGLGLGRRAQLLEHALALLLDVRRY